MCLGEHLILFCHSGHVGRITLCYLQSVQLPHKTDDKRVALATVCNIVDPCLGLHHIVSGCLTLGFEYICVQPDQITYSILAANSKGLDSTIYLNLVNYITVCKSACLQVSCTLVLGHPDSMTCLLHSGLFPWTSSYYP
jgi:hypothetical protein